MLDFVTLPLAGCVWQHSACFVLLSGQQQGVCAEWEEGENRRKDRMRPEGLRGWKDPSKKKREGQRGEQEGGTAPEPRETERKGREQRGLPHLAASAHGAGENLWESKQQRRIPICFQPLAARAGDYKDGCAGHGSVVKTEFMGGLLGLKVPPGSAWSFSEDTLLRTRRWEA